MLHHGCKIITSRQKNSHHGMKLISRQKMLHHGHGSKMISRWKITMVGRFYHSSFHRTYYVTLKITSTNNLKQPARHVWEKKFSRHLPHTPSWYRMTLPPALDASFPPRSPQIIPSDRHFGIRRILCSLLRHKSYLTLPYVTSLRDSFSLGTFAHAGFIRLLPCNLTSLQGCS